MELTFANFKQMIPPQILTRGRDYLRSGQILDLSFDEEEMIWEAQVEGTEVYDVRVEQTGQGTLLCSCTCPYDLGEHCKHIAAVLYAIEDTFPEQLTIKPRKKSAKRQTRHDKLRQRLEKTSREQLVAILLDLAQEDRELLNQLLIRLDTSEVKPMEYRRVVKDALRAGRGEYGFLDYTGSRRAARKLEDLITQANRWLETDQIDKAVGIYQAVIDETVPVIAHADDSDGMLSDCLNMAVEGLSESVELQSENDREALFSYCLERARQKEFQGWDWAWDLLDMAKEMVDTPVRRALFISALEDIGADISRSGSGDFYSSYRSEQIALFELALVERFDGPAAAREFLRAHGHLDRLRMTLIERCIDENALDEAMRLIQEGIAASDRRHLPGLINQYRALRVKLLQRSGDHRALIETARALWLDQGDEDTFALLKQTVPEPEWQRFVDELVKDIKRQPEQLAWLYAHEGRWRALMTLVQSSPQATWLLEGYRAPLESRFPDEVADIYAKIVDTILVRAAGRSHYQQAVAYLRRMKKLNQSERVETIVAEIKQRYANRPALLDELRRL